MSLAQGSTDCPTWSKKKTTSKADYFKYLSSSQGKKNVKIVPEQQQKSTQEQQSIPVHVAKTNRSTSTGNKSTSDFYTTRRYNLFPEEKKKVKQEEVAENEETENEKVENVEEKILEENVPENNTETVEVKKEVPIAIGITPEEPKIEEVQKASSTPAIATDDSKGSGSSAASKVHNKKGDKIFNTGPRHNGVKKNRRIGGKHRIDGCATKF